MYVLTPDGQEPSLSFHENMNGQWGALVTFISRLEAPRRTLMGLQCKAFKDVMLSAIWHVSSTRLFADVNPRISTVFILWCCCPCIFLRPEGSANMETCSISYWDTYNIQDEKGKKKL
jgi:hypothetical protein